MNERIIHCEHVSLQQLWGGLYQRGQHYQQAQDEIWKDIAAIKEQDKELKVKVIRMRK